jgi:hypothetical protein
MSSASKNCSKSPAVFNLHCQFACRFLQCRKTARGAVRKTVKIHPPALSAVRLRRDVNNPSPPAAGVGEKCIGINAQVKNTSHCVNGMRLRIHAFFRANTI